MKNEINKPEQQIASNATGLESSPAGRARGPRVEDLSVTSYHEAIRSRLAADQRFRLWQGVSTSVLWQNPRTSLPLACAAAVLLGLQFLLPGWLSSGNSESPQWLPWLRQCLIICGIQLLIVAAPRSASKDIVDEPAGKR